MILQLDCSVSLCNVGVFMLDTQLRDGLALRD